MSLRVAAGEVVALMGENGAGKSTLMKILSGVWPSGSFAGEVVVGGEARGFADTRDAHAAGIAMIHQELAVFPELTVAEHLELDRLPRWIRWDELHARTQKFLDTLGLGLSSRTRVGDLPVGGRQLVEIARALDRDARIIVFDEPTSALTDAEVTRLYAIVDRLRDEGRAIVYITHRMDEVFRLADRIVVLRDGRNAGDTRARDAEGKPLPRREIEPKLISWMVGRPIDDIYPPRAQVTGPERLRVEGLRLRNAAGKALVDGLSFSVRAGEILGLGGLLGAGRSETFQAIFGALAGEGPRGPGHEVTGKVFVGGAARRIGSPGEAIGARLAFVPEDRKGSGLVLGHSIRSNAALPSIASGRAGLGRGTSAWSGVDAAREEAAVRRWTSELALKSAGLEQAVGELSGGNQQKVVLAKWLLTEPEVLFLDEPTRGIDIGAKVEIYRWIARLAAQGMAVVMASSEMPELLGLCHRIIVLREGRFSAELEGARATQEDIMRAASL